MKSKMKYPLAAFGIAAALVAVALVFVRDSQSDAYDSYCARGGADGFWMWFAHDVCRIGRTDIGEKTGHSAKAEENQTARAKKTVRQSADAMASKASKQKQAAVQTSIPVPKTGAGKKKRRSVRELLGTRHLRDLSAATHGKHVSMKGNSVVAGGGAAGAKGAAEGEAEGEKEPYRVKAIRGIEFGSTDYSPGEDVDPLKCVWKSEDGTDSFERMLWCEFKDLDDSVYGFERAIFRHTLETEELASLTFFKCFPPTEEGMAQAVELYNSMSEEASAELGFKLSEVDRSSQNDTPTLAGFTSDEGETTIKGKIEARSGKSIAVSLTVVDKPYQQELVEQGNAFFDAGLVDSVDSFVETHANKDYSKPKDQAVGLLKGN